MVLRFFSRISLFIEKSAAKNSILLAKFAKPFRNSSKKAVTLLLMINQNNKGNKDQSDEQAEGSSDKHVHFHENVKKKEKKKIKFQLPLSLNSDETSIKPSTSAGLVEADQQEALISNEKLSLSFLKKYLNRSLKEVSPRSVVFKPCNRESFTENKDLLRLGSYQFFENKEVSPDDFNLNLIRAAHLGQIRAAKKAIRKGADVNTVQNKHTSLMIATDGGDTRFVKYLLKVPGIEVNTKNNLGQTPLITATANGYDEIVILLLKHNADVNLQDNMGKTALHIALFHQQTHLIKILLAFGANFDLADSFGEKPMYTASVKKPSIKYLKMLLKMGAVPDYLTTSGLPLLSRSILSGAKLKIIETLVRSGASVNLQDAVSKKTPLHYAALINNLQVAEFLISEGADPNLKTTYNFTPLDEAKIQRSHEVKMYLKKFHNPQFQNEKEIPRLHKKHI